MPEKRENTYVFIDSQNLNLGVQALGWKLDFKAFRVYLRQKTDSHFYPEDPSAGGLD